jgi:hypothetical protein
MNNKLFASLLTTLAAVTALSCSTPTPQVIDTVPPPEVDLPLPLEPYASRLPNQPPPLDPNLVGKMCQLGTSCLALDSRPFEVCLLGTQKRCTDKATEPLLVENPEVEPR